MAYSITKGYATKDGFCQESGEMVLWPFPGSFSTRGFSHRFTPSTELLGHKASRGGAQPPRVHTAHCCNSLLGLCILCWEQCHRFTARSTHWESLSAYQGTCPKSHRGCQARSEATSSGSESGTFRYIMMCRQHVGLVPPT